MARTEFLARALMWRGDRVLVCRDLARGHAYLPGGHVEFGESAADAVRRELEEECGLRGRVGAPRLAWDMRFVQGGAKKQEFSVVFHVEPRQGGSWPEVVPSREPHIAFEWMSREDGRRGGLVPEPLADWLSDQDPLPGSGGADWLSIDESA